MSIKTKIFIIAVAVLLMVSAAYKVRGGWAVGSEWLLLSVIGAAADAIPMKERNKRC